MLEAEIRRRDESTVNDIPPDMVAALNEATPAVLSVEGINGIDIGLDDAGEYVFRVLVDDPDDPPAGLPDDIGGFGYMLVAGRPTLDLAGIPDEQTYGRPGRPPIVGGIQIAPDVVVGSAGTLGCVFRNSDGDPVGISNAHVMCEAASNVIMQAAGGVRLGTVQTCLIPDTPPLFPPGPPSGVWDAAICSIEDGRPYQIGEIAEIGTATAISSPQLGDVVRKRGHKTGVTYGVVTGVLGAYDVTDTNGNVKWWMLGQISIAMIPDLGLNPLGVWSRGGDSGSVVVNANTEIVALHWGGYHNTINPNDPAEGHTGYATDFSTLAIALGITL
jgi:hypothetical protein